MKTILVPLHGGGVMKVTASGDGPPLFDLSAVTPAVIAHGLARTNRFGGQTPKPFSDAEHSVNLAEWMGALGYGGRVQQFCLIHDAAECLGFGDPHRDVKRAFATDLRRAEGELVRALERHLLTARPYEGRQADVAEYDHLIGNHEADQFGFPSDVTHEAFALARPQPPLVQFWCPEIAERRWLRLWEKLG